MGHPAPTDLPVLRKPVQARPATVSKPLALAAQPNLLRLDSLVFSQQESHTGRRGLSFASSLGLHSIILAAVITLPLLIEDVLPEPGQAIRGFFVTPPDVAPPPPPPPPPAAAPRSLTRPAATRPQPVEDAKFLAPIEIPEQVQQPEELLDLGVEGGVAGGVEGGVPGGVLGGVVGGLPQAQAPPPPAALVRVGGVIRAPKLIESPRPEYPALATQARVAALLILEAEVGPDGRVRAVKVLRGHPLFDESAMVAVRRWRYQPLLLNGVPTPFLVTVTVNFNLKTGEAPTAQ